eukprot:TRINITY_DN15813_c0_g1_i1.p1 TRINITY_DN15813_c0_g1~~TRINITY_DN15813_c0_g1_i1.p1  ORF type:complete len:894 (-),score=152.93 TRINITY_DN15813_c0_g1_i1:346-3027(-)
MSMQAGSSKSNLPKQTSGSAQSKGKLNPSSKIESSASRTKNTSAGDSAGVGSTGRTMILCDGKNVTPKSLVPAHYQKVADSGADPSQQANQPAPLTKEEERAEQEKANAVIPDKVKTYKPQTLSKDELERNVDIVLGETDTDTLLFFPSLCVPLDNPMSSQIPIRNKAYEELCAQRADSDQYAEQHCQTMNQPHKSKEVFAELPRHVDVEVNANGWDIYDSFATDPVPKHEQIQQACEKESQATITLAVKKPGCLFTMNEPYPTSEANKEQGGKKATGKDDLRRSGKTGGVGAANSSTLRSGVSGGASTALKAGSSATGLGGGATNDSGQGAAAAGGATADASPDGPTGEAADQKPPEGAAEGEEGPQSPTEAEEAPGAPIDEFPWKVGAENPIPEDLGPSLRVMERIVSQNVFHRQHMIYRNYPTLEELARLDQERLEEAIGSGIGGLESIAEAAPTNGERQGAGLTEAEGDGVADGDDAVGGTGEETLEEISREEGASKPYLQDLFCFDAPQLTQGMTVTCAEWNRHNQDLLAVSYGDTAPVPSTPGGLVLFWSLKNPTYPERVIRTRHGVTALHFSSVHSNMVAAGTHDGSVMIWDLRKPSDVPVLRSGSSVSTHNDQKHTDIVWETRWVEQGPDKQPPELLVSVSSDGNVLQWSLKKGLEQMPLMPLRRLANPHLGANSVYGHKEGRVFRTSSGFCVDFPRHDPSTYLVGTEDGLVHRCSTSYNEQYLDTYYGHSGPVYRVRCNPFMSHAFLTCSADWTMKLWTTKHIPGHQPETPLLTFQSTDLFDSVNDVIWAPHNSTSFAAAMDDGRIELWDLSEKPLDPIVVHYPQVDKPQRRRTCVRFSPNSPVLVAGADNGSVDVMRMYNTNQSYYSDQEQQDRLAAVMVKKR